MKFRPLLAGCFVLVGALAASAADPAVRTIAFDDLHIRVPDPAKVAAALTELREAAARNIGGATTGGGAVSVPGMTPNPLAQRVSFTGHGADGKALQEHAAFFVKGLRVYQASVVGAKIDPEAADTFIAGLRMAS